MRVARSASLPLDAGRIVYGIAAIALGVTNLVFHDFATVWHPVPATAPFRAGLALLAAWMLVAGGVATLWRRSATAGISALAILYLLGALLWVRRMIGFPELFGVWSGFAEELSLVLAAATWLATTGGRAARTLTLLRIAFGACVVVFGVAHFSALPQTAAMVPAWVPPSRMFWAEATGAAMLAAGVSIMTGVAARWAAWLLAALLMSFGLFVWTPSVIAFSHQHVAWAGSAINLAITAGAWMVAASIDADGSRMEKTR